MLAALTVANRLADKRESLEEASGHLDALRIALRLAKRLAFPPNRGYAALSETIDEVGRMLGGWLKHEGACGCGVRFTMWSPLIERYLAAEGHLADLAQLASAIPMVA